MWVVPFISTSLTYDLRQVYIYIYIHFFSGNMINTYIYIYITSYSTHSQWIPQSTWTPYVTSICITNACPTSYLVSWTSSRMPQLHGIQRGDSIWFFHCHHGRPSGLEWRSVFRAALPPPTAGLLVCSGVFMESSSNSVPTCSILKEATATNKSGWIYLIR